MASRLRNHLATRAPTGVATQGSSATLALKEALAGRHQLPLILTFSLPAGYSSRKFGHVIFSESPAFTKAVQEILREEDYFELQDLLIDRPDAGDVIPGSKGLRKIRVASGGRGKRGGSRVIYYWYVEPEKIQFCRIYEKSHQADLPKAEIHQIQTELDP